MQLIVHQNTHHTHPLFTLKYRQRVSLAQVKEVDCCNKVTLFLDFNLEDYRNKLSTINRSQSKNILKTLYTPRWLLWNRIGLETVGFVRLRNLLFKSETPRRFCLRPDSLWLNVKCTLASFLQSTWGWPDSHTRLNTTGRRLKIHDSKIINIYLQ